MDNGGKRKRALEHPRIVYHAHNRTFDRLFKETSLSEMKDVVRKKLELPENATFTLAQLRGDTFVDLEDDDDFEAFDALAHSSQSVEVRISVSDPSQEEEGSSANARSRHVSFHERKDASKRQKTPAPEVARPPPSKRRKLNTGKIEALHLEDDNASNEATTGAKKGKQSKSVAGTSNVNGTESITSTLNITAATNSSTQVETPVSRPKRRRASVTEPTPASKLKEQVEATGAPELPPAKPKRKKTKHKKSAVDDGATADVETDSLNPPTNDKDSAKEALPRQRRKSVSKPTNESKGNVDQPKDDAPQKPSDEVDQVKTRATTKALAKQDAPQSIEPSKSTTSKKKSSKNVTTDETPLPSVTRATSSRKKTKASRPTDDEPVSETFQAAAATLKSWSVVPADAAVATPLPLEPPSKATVEPSKDVPKGEKKGKAKKVNGHSICPPPSAKDSAPESDIVPPVAGPSSGSRAKGGLVIRPDESSDSDTSSSDVPLQKKVVKRTITKPTREEKDLEAIVRGPRKSRASVARLLLEAEKEEEARGVDGKDDEGEALEEEEEQKGRKKTSKRSKNFASSSSDSEDVGMEELSKDTTPSPDPSRPPTVQVQPSVEEPPSPMPETLQPAAEIVQDDEAATILAPDSSDEIESTHTSPDAVDDIQPNPDSPTADCNTPTPAVKVMNRMKGKSPAKTPSSSQTLPNRRNLFSLRTQSPAIARKLLGTASSSESSQLPSTPTTSSNLAQDIQAEVQKNSQGSVARWTPLMPKSPSSIPKSMMEDELASSPQDVLKTRPEPVEETQLPDPDQPALFLASNTQTQFPYTQTVIRSPSPLRQHDSGEDEEENEVAAAVKVPAPQFRRLTEIEVSSRSMFAKSARKKGSGSAAAGMRTRSMNNATSLYGTLGSQRDDDSDSDADSGSDEEKEKEKASSHIPKSRRAGVK